MGDIHRCGVGTASAISNGGSTRAPWKSVLSGRYRSTPLALGRSAAISCTSHQLPSIELSRDPVGAAINPSSGLPGRRLDHERAPWEAPPRPRLFVRNALGDGD